MTRRSIGGFLATLLAMGVLAGVAAHATDLVPKALAAPGDPCDPAEDPECDPPPETGRLTVTKSVYPTRATITSAPAGIDCGATCSADFTADESVTLTATVDSGFGVGSWSGCATVNGTSCTVDVSADGTTVGISIVDSVDPTVNLDWPSGGSYRGSIGFGASASDANGIAAVRFRVDGVLVSTDTTSPYGYFWDSTGRNGSVSVAAEAVDNAGRTRSHSRWIAVDNVAPTVSITSPSADAFVTGPTTVVAAASDGGSGINSASFSIRNHPTAPTYHRSLGSDATSPYTAPLDFTGLPGDGAYYLLVTVWDNVFNSSTATTPITIDRQAPSVVITSPDEGQLATTGSLGLAATADDATTGPPSVAWAYAPTGGSGFTAIGTGASTTWDVSALADGSYTVRATATDGAGLQASDTNTVVLDRSAPTASLGAVPAVAKSRRLTISWSGSDAGSGIASFDVRARSAAANAATYGPWSLWQQGVTAPSAAFTGVQGSSTCFSVRATDAAGHRGAWTLPRCTSIPLDDRALTTSGSWIRNAASPGDSRYYEGTFSRSSSTGATLTRSGLKALQVSLLVTRCSSCGKVQVLWNGRVVRTLDLAAGATTTRRKQVVTALTFSSVQTGTLVLRQASSGRTIEIDGVAIGK